MELRKLAAIAVLLAAPAAAQPQGPLVEGSLELAWGDPHPALRQNSTLLATLVLDNGRRIELDSASARHAAEDLYALSGQRVVVAFAPDERGRLLISSESAIEAIIPAQEPLGFSLQPTAQGSTAWRTIACKFADEAAEQRTIAFFTGQYGDAPGQLGHYWREVSYNAMNLQGSSAHGWFTLPHPRSHYIPADGGRADLTALFNDCTAAADPTVDFGTNGGVQGINMMFNANLDGSAWGGRRCATLDGVNKCWSVTWNPPWSFSNNSVLAHEMGHGYGLPHANNSDRDSDPYDNPWDVMSDAWRNAVNDPTYGTLPKHINTYHRDRLGWIAAPRKLDINTDGSFQNIQLDYASLAFSLNRQMIVVRVPGSTTYYTLEARVRTGTYENRLAGDAVIIHEVVPNRTEPSWSVDADDPPATISNNEGSMFKVGETWTSPDRAFSVSIDGATASGFVLSIQRPAVVLERDIVFVNPATNQTLETLLRFTNKSDAVNDITMTAYDDQGVAAAGPVNFSLPPRGGLQLTSREIEQGNAAKGLVGSFGTGVGKWRIKVDPSEPVEVMSLIRSNLPMLSNVSDLAHGNSAEVRDILFANPASNRVQETFLRLSNPGNSSNTITLTATDDMGVAAPGGSITLTLGPRQSRLINSVDYETGAPGKGLSGAFGTGTGKWRIRASGTRPLQAMGLTRSPNGFLSNLSDSVPKAADGSFALPYVIANPSLDHESLLRVMNTSNSSATVTLTARDDAGNALPGPPLSLSLPARRSVQLTTRDLALGNSERGLTGSFGAGTGLWQVRVHSSNAGVQVMNTVRNAGGTVSNMSTPSPRLDNGRYEVDFFNPASNTDVRTYVRIANASEQAANVTIRGVDDAGNPAPGGAVTLTLPPNAARLLNASQIENGATGLTGSFGKGSGKWQLEVEADADIRVLAIAESPGGISNLSQPVR